MTYQEIGHLLFPCYLVGCLIACVVNCTSKRMFSLSAFYALYVIGLFQIRFDGYAPLAGWHWYILVAELQFSLMLLVNVMYFRVTHVFTLLAFLMVMVNVIYSSAWTLHPLPRHVYFVSVAGLQTLEIISLITYSSLWPDLWRWVTRAPDKARRLPWQMRFGQP